MKRKFFFTQVCAVLAGFSSIAQAPVNDECANAIVFATTPFGASCSSTVAATTRGAAKSSPNPSCTSVENDDDVWYRFTAASQSVVIRFGTAVEVGTGDDAIVGFALYSGLCFNATQLVCNNLGSAGSGYTIIDGLTIGDTYQLRFWSTLTGTNHIDFSFCVQDVPAPPANDECSGAMALTVQPAGTNCSSGVKAITTGATRSTPDPSCASGFNNDDLWYSFVAPATGIRLNFSNARLTTAVSGNANLGYALYSGTCPVSATAFRCINNIGSGSGSHLIGGLTPGQTYYLRLFSFGPNNYMSTDFCLVAVNLPPNDECVSAAPLSVGEGFCTNPVMGNLLNATTSAGFGAPACAALSTSEDVWHRVIVPPSGNLTVRTSTADDDIIELVMEAYSGVCGSLSLLACSDDANNGPPGNTALTDFHPRIVLTGRTPGETIYLRVLGKGVINFGPYSICAWDHSARPVVASAGTCTNLPPVSITAANGNLYHWVPLFNTGGDIVAEIFANGHELGTIDASLYIQTGLPRSFNGKYYLDRNLSITPSGNGSAVLRIYFKQSEFVALRDADPLLTSAGLLGIIKTPGDCAPFMTATGVLLGQQSNVAYGPDRYLQFETPSFSNFYISRMDAPLPVILSAYSATCKKEEVWVEWTSSFERNHSFFTVERGRDGISFETIATVTNGNDSGEGKKYLFIDRAPPPGKNYYRLKQTDIDGSAHYFSALGADCGLTGHTVVYPNPFAGEIRIRMQAGIARGTAELWSASGLLAKKWIYAATAGSELRLSATDVIPGIYFLRLLTDKGDAEVFRLLKRQE